MTAKDKLRQAVEELSELEAEQTLAFIASRREIDPVIDASENAPADDEPFTVDDERALDEGREAYRRGETFSSTTSAANLAERQPWRLTFSAPARRDLRRLDPPIARRVLAALEQLVAESARPPRTA
jgi:hypothetical protein